AEGKGQGVDRHVLEILSGYDGLPVTYAGGISSYEDIRLIEEAGQGRIDFTVGSRLDIFGGDLKIHELAKKWGWN
nr:phosphoribosylformimino-5-aminoimidazole carboxamide ribotide isomerase [Lachnospiraceae bacterium]